MKLLSHGFNTDSTPVSIYSPLLALSSKNNFDDNKSMNALVMTAEVGGSMIKTLPLESLLFYYFVKIVLRMETGDTSNYFLQHPYCSTFQYHTERYANEGSSTKAERLDTGSGPFQVTNDFIHEYFILTKNQTFISKYLTAHVSFLLTNIDRRLTKVPIEQFMAVWWFVFSNSRRITIRNHSTRTDTSYLLKVLATKMSQSSRLRGQSLKTYYSQLLHDFNQLGIASLNGALSRFLVELYHIYYGNAKSREKGNPINTRLLKIVSELTE